MKRSSTHIIHIGDREITYTLHRKSRQKHQYLRIKDGQLIVSAPYLTSINSINRFISQKSNWVLSNLTEKEKFDLLGPEAKVYLLGKPYTTEWQADSEEKVIFIDQKAIFCGSPNQSNETLLALLHRYYKKQAPDTILPRVEYWSDKMDLHPNKVTFRKAKTRWGSCSSRNTISLNIYLMMLPMDLIDYVVVHELAHIRHKNHSGDFWDLVSRYVPNYQQIRKDIRKFEQYLL